MIVTCHDQTPFTNLVCTNCHEIKCVQMESDLERLEKKIQKTHNFRVKNQVLEFFGLCSECS